MESLENLWNEFGRIKPPPPPPIQMRNYNDFIEFISKLQNNKPAVERLTQAFEAYYQVCNNAANELEGVINELKSQFEK
jgi:hypothetical protein